MSIAQEHFSKRLARVAVRRHAADHVISPRCGRIIVVAGRQFVSAAAKHERSLRGAVGFTPNDERCWASVRSIWAAPSPRGWGARAKKRKTTATIAARSPASEELSYPSSARWIGEPRALVKNVRDHVWRHEFLRRLCRERIKNDRSRARLLPPILTQFLHRAAAARGTGPARLHLPCPGYAANWLSDHPKWMLSRWRCEHNIPRATTGIMSHPRRTRISKCTAHAYACRATGSDIASGNQHAVRFNCRAYDVARLAGGVRCGAIAPRGREGCRR